jgi:hypothetical protein
VLFRSPPTLHTTPHSTHPTHHTSLHPPYTPDLTPPTLHTRPHSTSTCSQRQSQCSKEHIFCQWKVWKHKWRRSSTAFQNMTCGIALNVCSIVCRCVSTGKGTVRRGSEELQSVLFFNVRPHTLYSKTDSQLIAYYLTSLSFLRS